MPELPLPPVVLANRVGHTVGPDGSFDGYQVLGRILHDVVVNCLPDDWTWAGKRVLDFGSGAGRTLRHFAAEAAEAEFHGCDIDAEGIAWLNANLNPPLQGFVNDEKPPLAQPDGSYDLIYAFSVFTHIADEWSGWALEMHRLLAPGGLLIASFLGEGMSETIAGEPWDENRIGMNVLKIHQDWARGGPSVMLSPWWIEGHWGRAFEIVSIDPGSAPNVHGMMVLSPKPSAPTRAELEWVDPAEPREVAALRHNVRQLQRESQATAAELDAIHATIPWRLAAKARRLIARR
jgi:SAM-dependent methyltransferase